MPYSPNATRVPPEALPLRFGWCCLRCLTLRGMSMTSALCVRSSGLDCCSFGRCLDSGGFNGCGLNGSCLNGCGLNGSCLNGCGLNGCGLNGSCLNGCGLNGGRLDCGCLNASCLDHRCFDGGRLVGNRTTSGGAAG